MVGGLTLVETLLAVYLTCGVCFGAVIVSVGRRTKYPLPFPEEMLFMVGMLSWPVFIWFVMQQDGEE